MIFGPRGIQTRGAETTRYPSFRHDGDGHVLSATLHKEGRRLSHRERADVTLTIFHIGERTRLRPYQHIANAKITLGGTALENPFHEDFPVGRASKLDPNLGGM